jgi:transcriptional regulator with XRE-family HTH domain
MSAFADVMKAALKRRDLSQRKFADLAECSGGFVCDVINDKRTPPLDRIMQWADALGLEDEDRQRFMDLAGIAHLPATIRPTFEQIYLNNRAIEAGVDAFRTKNAELAVKNAEVTRALEASEKAAEGLRRRIAVLERQLTWWAAREADRAEGRDTLIIHPRRLLGFTVCRFCWFCRGFGEGAVAVDDARRRAVPQMCLRLA